MPEWLGVAIAVLYGTIVGSFLNVCIWRLPRDESLTHPGSHCPQCGKLLRAWDLVPLFSFLLQGCKCRYCKGPITWRYFSVELLTGVYFGLAYMFALNNSNAVVVDFLQYALFGAALIAIFFIDLEHWIIPDQLSVFGIVLGIGRDVYGLVSHTRETFHIPVPWTSLSVPLPQSLAGIFACGGTFLAIAVVSYYIFKKEGIGGGDIKLAAAVGANLALGPAMLSFFIAVALGSFIGIGLMIFGRKSRKDYVPFGPMMVAGAFVSMFYGQTLIKMYYRLVGLDG